MEYQVEDSDTLERIAARFECTVGQLMKLNKMNSRMVFAGQTLIVPSPLSDEVFEESKVQNGLYPAPGTAVQVTPQQPVSTQPSRSETKDKNASVVIKEKSQLNHSTTKADVDCLQRFLKVKVKNVTEKDGTVTGTLLVTPNALMFDPDVTHPLVKENGQDLYMMMAPMEDITSVAVFKDIGALTGEKDKGDIYDPDHISRSAGTVKESGDDEETIRTSEQGNISPRIGMKNVNFDEVITNIARDQRNCTRLRALGGSDSQLPLIAEEEQKYGADLDVPTVNRRTVSDVGSPIVGCHDDNQVKKDATSSSSLQKLCEHTEAPPSANKFASKASPTGSRNSLAKLSRTLSAHANSIRDSAEKVTQSAVTGTKSVAHGVVTHTRSAAETLQTGIQSGAKLAASHAKVAVDAVVSVPQGLVNISTGLFSEGQQQLTDMVEPPKDNRAVATVRRQQSLATLENLKQRTLQAREQACKEREAALFTCATSPDDKPDLFRPVQELVDQARKTLQLTAPLLTTELPYYMAVRLNRKRLRAKASRSISVTSSSLSAGEFDGDLIGNRKCREFWFAIPRERVDGIYHFLLQWNPEKYGQDASYAAGDEGVVEDSYSTPISGYQFTDNSFIILDSEVDEKLAGPDIAF